MLNKIWFEAESSTSETKYDENVEVIPSSSIGIQPLVAPFYPLAKDMERRTLLHQHDIVMLV
jgi:hypothetical protein